MSLIYTPVLYPPPPTPTPYRHATVLTYEWPVSGVAAIRPYMPGSTQLGNDLYCLPET